MSTAALAQGVKSAAPVHRAGRELRINRPGDAYEREAERAADEVMKAGPRRATWSLSKIAMSAPLQRECACGGQCDDCKKKDMDPLQRDALDSTMPPTVPDSVHQVLRGSGMPLDGQTRSLMESGFGYDFGRVRIFNDASAARSATEVAAKAYTVGEKVVFNQARYSPASQEGRRLLAHELAHVVQQGFAAPSASAAQRKATLPASQPMGEQGVGMPASSPPLLRASARDGAPTLQRAPLLTADAAGGCGVCFRGDLKKVGNTAHTLIQSEFQVQYPFLLPEFPVGTKLKTIISEGRPDLVLPTPTGLKIGEIKPANANNYFEGEAKLVIYEKLLKAKYPSSKIERMNLPPVPPMPFVDTRAKNCTPQTLVTSPSVHGVYGYLCVPNFQQLRSTCKCDDGDGKPIPFPVKDPKTVTDKKDKKVKEDKRVDEPHEAPDLVPAFAALALAAITYLATKAAPKLGLKMAGPVMAVLSMAAIAILLAEGKAEAHVGPGEEPIKQLLDSLDQQGITVPPDVRSMIENNPDLKAKMEKAMAKGGDPSAAQQAINEQILKIIEEHKNELSADDLAMVLDATQAAGKALPQSAATEQAILKAIKEHNAAGDGQGSGSSDSAKPGALKPSDGPSKAGSGERTPGDAGPKADQPAAQPPPTGLTQKGRARLGAAPEPVRSLFAAITAGAGAGDAANDASVEEYLSIVPGDLTGEEAQKLVKRLAAATGKSAADVLASLRQAIAELRPAPTPKPSKPAAAGDKPQAGDKPASGEASPVPKNAVGDGAAAAKPAKDPANAGGQSGAAGKKSEAEGSENEALAHLAAAGDFSGIQPGQYLVSWGNTKSTRVELLYIDPNGLHSAAYATVQITKLDRPNKIVTVRVVGMSPLVAADGSVQPAIRNLVGTVKTLKIPPS